jgi:conjugal transfer/type IV secretion protein DotA/TraY
MAIDLLGAIPDTDIALGWINVLFPASDTAYASAIAVYTMTLTFLASLFLAWHVVSGVISTATTGKILGEKYHQIYAPLRVVLGFGLLVPIADGWSAVHIGLRDIIAPAAINLANAPIKLYVNSVALGKQSAVLRGHQGDYVVRHFVQMEACTAVMNTLSTSLFGSHKITKSGPITVPIEEGASWGLFGNAEKVSEKVVWDYEDCGSVSFVLSEANASDAVNNFYAERMLATTNTQTAIANVFADADLDEYISRYGLGESGNQALLDELIRDGTIPANLLGSYQIEVKEWNTRVGKAATEVFRRDNERLASEITKFINDYGFMAAGATERTLAEISGQASRLASETPVVMAPRLEERYLNAYGQVLHLFAGLSDQQRGKAAAAGVPMLSEADAGADGSGMVNYILSKISPFLARPPVGSPDHDKLLADPVGGMIAFGHLLLNAFQVMFVTIMAGSAAAQAAVGGVDNPVGWFGLKAVAQGAAGAFEYASGWMGVLMTLILAIGILHAFVLPMIPFIMVVILGIGWLIMFLEAVIAAPLWAFMLVRMDGNEFFDRHQAPGVSLLFNLFLRPAIGILAFIGGSLLLNEILGSIIVIWDRSSSYQMSPDFLGVFYWAIGNVLLVFLMWHLYLRLFGLIPAIADHIGHWMGLGASPSFNDGSETSAAVGAAVGVGMATRQLPVAPRPRQGKVKAASDDSPGTGGDRPKGGRSR